MKASVQQIRLSSNLHINIDEETLEKIEKDEEFNVWLIENEDKEQSRQELEKNEAFHENNLY